MGVDVSSQTLAFSIFEHGNLMMWGEIDFKGANLFQRIGSGQSRMHALKDYFQVDKIAVEGAIYVQNKKTVILLAYSLGAALAPLINDDTVVEELSPVAWQREIGNPPLTKVEKAAVAKEYPDKTKSWYSAEHRRIRKERTMKWVKDTYGVDVESDNVSDAIAIGWVSSRG